MFIVISPAKKITTDIDYTGETSSISFKNQTKELVNILKTRTQRNLGTLMSLSPKLSQLNYERYQNFNPTVYNKKNSKPALFLFQGDVYRNLKADSFTEKELQFAQQHLGILLGLYGCLSPLDLIQPYRLEMSIPLENSLGDTLYDFWKSRVTEHLNESIAATSNNLLLNLASQEYFSVIDKQQLNADIINIVFKDWKNGALKTIGVQAKRARGTMVHYIVKNGYKSLNAIKKFNGLGYCYSAGDSNDHTMTFIR